MSLRRTRRSWRPPRGVLTQAPALHNCAARARPLVFDLKKLGCTRATSILRGLQARLIASTTGETGPSFHFLPRQFRSSRIGGEVKVIDALGGTLIMERGLSEIAQAYGTDKG